MKIISFYLLLIVFLQPVFPQDVIERFNEIKVYDASLDKVKSY